MISALTYFATALVGGILGAGLGLFLGGLCHAARRADDESEAVLKVVRDETEVIDFWEWVARNAESRGNGPGGAA